MAAVTVAAHFDGERIVLDEPFPLTANARLLVTVLPDTDMERRAWLDLSPSQLADAYGDDEPERSPSVLPVG
jgi:hypothetical protein